MGLRRSRTKYEAMLLISAGMYVRRDVPIYEHTHQAVFTDIGPVTDIAAVASASVETPVGWFTFPTTLGAVNPVMAEVVDRREQLNEGGSGPFLLATGGTKHRGDTVDVLAFALNVTISRDAGLVRRLAPDQVPTG